MQSKSWCRSGKTELPDDEVLHVSSKAVVRIVKRPFDQLRQCVEQRLFHSPVLACFFLRPFQNPNRPHSASRDQLCP
jgi:hypothetical protein